MEGSWVHRTPCSWITCADTHSTHLWSKSLKLKHLWSVVSRAQTSFNRCVSGSSILGQQCLAQTSLVSCASNSRISGQQSLAQASSIWQAQNLWYETWKKRGTQFFFFNSLIQYIQTTASSPSFLPSSSPQPPLSPRSTVPLIPFRKEQTLPGRYPHF